MEVRSAIGELMSSMTTRKTTWKKPLGGLPMQTPYCKGTEKGLIFIQVRTNIPVKIVQRRSTEAIENRSSLF